MSTTLQPLPNPFLTSQNGSRAQRPNRFTLQPALLAFLICLVVGLVIVGWRAKTRANEARARAALEASARGVAVESQLSQVVSAAEVLGILARQHAGALPDFQRVAAELIKSRPGLASLDLEPGGVVSDIAPRAASTPGIGLNVLSHPTYQSGANAALKRRALTVTAPVPLYTGEPGILVRVPVYQRGRDGRDAFWGFVASSMRLTEALSRARVDDLVQHGYNYAFIGSASGREKGQMIAAHGALSAPSAVQQSVRVQDVEFRLLLEPRSGWISKTKLALEFLGVLLVSGLAGLVVNLLENCRAMEAALADVNQRLDREKEDRRQAELAIRSAKDEAAAAQVELNQTRSALQTSNEAEVRLSVSVRAAEASAQAARVESDQLRSALQQAEQMIVSLQSRLRAAARARKEAEAAPPVPPKEEPPAIADVPVPQAVAVPPEAPPVEPGPASPSQVEAPRQEPSPSAEAPDVAPSVSEPAPEIVPATAAALEPEPLAAPVPVEPAAPVLPPPPEPAAEKKPAKAPRRKKARRDSQLDFFAPQPVAEPAPSDSSSQAVEEPPAVESPSLPDVESLAAPVASSAEELEKPAASASEPADADSKPKEIKPARPLPPRPPLDLAQLRKAVNVILPLFTGRDPGARDCLKDNRTTFRSAFAPEAYQEFEESVKGGDFDAALEHLKKAAKKLGIPV